MSTGLATRRRMVWGEMGDMELKIEDRMCRLRLSRERRDSPGECQFDGCVVYCWRAWRKMYRYLVSALRLL
jgi:hypothetical protein